MSEHDRVEKVGKFSTKLSDDQFLHFAENSTMGVSIIQRGYLKYFNQKFTEIFSYTEEDILKWKKREFYKIVHPEDLPIILKKLKIEDDKKTATVRFRGIKKNNQIIDIINYNCKIEYNGKTAYLASYAKISPEMEEEFTPKKFIVKTKRIIVLDYHPKIIEVLRDNNVNFYIIKNYSYREED
jgi:PAS domain S-box-containing protein